MATAKDYANWIVANADKKGTKEFETVAEAYQMAKSPEPRLKPWEMHGDKPFAEDINEAGAAQFGRPPGISLNMDQSAASPNFPTQGGVPQRSLLQQEAEQTGSGEAFLVGAGRTMDKMGSGVQDLMLTPSAFAGNEAARSQRNLIKADQAEKDRLYQSLSEAKPKSTFAGEMTPYLLAPRRIPGLSQATSNIAIPAGMGFSEYGEAEDRLQKGAIGAAAGVGGNTAARLIGGMPLSPDLDPYIFDTIRRGEQLGFRVVPSVRRESRSLQTREASLVSDPVTSDIASAPGEHNERQLVRIAARSIGLDDVDRLSPDQLNTARQSIVREFETTGVGTRVDLDNEFLDDLGRISARYQEGAGRRSNKINNIIDDLMDFGNSMSPEQYRRQISTLATDARSAAARDGGKSQTMYEIREALDQAFDRSTGSGDLAGFREARNRYRSLMALEGAVSEAGDVSVAKLSSTLKRSDKAGYVYGNRESELYDALRFLQVFPKQFGRPGTAESLSGRSSRDSLLGRMRDPALAGAAVGHTFAGAQGATVGGAVGAGLGLLSQPSQQMAARLYYSEALNRGLRPMGQGASDLISSGTTKALIPAFRSQ